jgi:hypothetical protein
LIDKAPSDLYYSASFLSAYCVQIDINLMYQD